MQGAIAGIIPQSTLTDPMVQEALAQSLATVMARNEPGIGHSIEANQVAAALISGDFSGVQRLANQHQAKALRSPYQETLDAILNQNLGEDSPIFADGNSAGERIRSGFGGCGLSLRQVGGATALSTNNQGNESATLEGINDFLTTNPTDKEIKERFGVATESQVRILRNSVPFQTKREFLERLSDNADGVNGLSAWTTFISNTPEVISESSNPEVDAGENL